MEKLFSMISLFCFAYPPARLLIAAGFPAGQSWGKGGRCRRHVPTDTHRQPMPERCGGMGDLLVWSLRAGRKQSGADGVAASLGEREARERAAERDATQAVSKARRDLRERSPGADRKKKDYEIFFIIFLNASKE